MFASGRASKYSENETAKLNEIMQKTDKNYISVVIISARELNIVG
jgi:hypothetical protein